MGSDQPPLAAGECKIAPKVLYKQAKVALDPLPLSALWLILALDTEKKSGAKTAPPLEPFHGT